MIPRFFFCRSQLFSRLSGRKLLGTAFGFGSVLSFGSSFVLCTSNDLDSEKLQESELKRENRDREFVEKYSSPNSAECFEISKLFDDSSVSSRIFEHVTEEYDDLGQIEVDEVEVTVQPHVFSQIGVIDKDGVRKLAEIILRENAFVDNKQKIRFCDIGSGVGNVLMQILGEVLQCEKVVGVEIIPSRHRMAVKAFENAKKYFPNEFCSRRVEVTKTNTITSVTEFEDAHISNGDSENKEIIRSTTTSETSTSVRTYKKDASFYLMDLVGAGQTLAGENVNVIFSHSWMFDDDLMLKFAQTVVESGSQLQMVFTSRPFVNQKGEGTLPPSWLCAGVISLSSDWNPHSPFFVYVRKE